MKYSFITQHKNTCPISLQCQVLGVKRSAYYQYIARQRSHKEDKNHQEMLEWIENIAESYDHTYSSRRIKKALNILGYSVSRNKARKLMREAGVSVKQRKRCKVTSNSNHKQLVFENLLERQFDVAQMDQAYVPDVTYIWTQEG
ncbi:MAG: IS3 family transposase [Candidatus Thiodiazotropha sp. (ex Lucinoma aequizonata)]|nr:IS3 family transposase [Candidatus Thiodiazotropha sp. (ex Lucinoma aequizonata)]MCU7903398.1 IS3 family transposase [Candidatus Thiodiazotropha sp. (ex Lucinoma aequizonata)]